MSLSAGSVPLLREVWVHLRESLPPRVSCRAAPDMGCPPPARVLLACLGRFFSSASPGRVSRGGVSSGPVTQCRACPRNVAHSGQSLWELVPWQVWTSPGTNQGWLTGAGEATGTPLSLRSQARTPPSALSQFTGPEELGFGQIGRVC